MRGTSNSYVYSTPRILELYVLMYILYRDLMNERMNE